MARSRSSSTKKTAQGKKKKKGKSGKKDSSVEPHETPTLQEWQLWVSPNPYKRATEWFYLWYCVYWVALVFVVVAFQLFELFDPWGYLLFALLLAVPAWVVPLLYPFGDAHIPWYKRYAFKSNVWIWIMSFVANHVWTHYFYQVLGASYSFNCWRFNDVPINLHVMTHPYFHLYHLLSNGVIRRVRAEFSVIPRKQSGFHAKYIGRFSSQPGWVKQTCLWTAIFILAVFLAFSEAFTIQHFPYYEMRDRRSFYIVGSVCYGLYFVSSFPLYVRLDEAKGEVWTLFQSFIEAMGNCMIITLLLDAFRIFYGPIYEGAAPPAVTPYIFIPQ